MLIAEIEKYRTTYEFTSLGNAVLIIAMIFFIAGIVDYMRSFIQNYKINKLKLKKEKMEIEILERR